MQKAILTCKGLVELFGRKREMKEKVELDRHVIASKEPRLHTFFLPKDSVAARIIINSGCFALNFFDGNEMPCEKLLDSFKLEGHSLECEVINIEELGDSVQITSRVVHEG